MIAVTNYYSALSALYATPIVSVGIGQFIYHYGNDYLTALYIRRHHGVFEPEARLPLCYLGSLLMFAGQLYVSALPALLLC